MIWNGKSKGTFNNIVNLIKYEKTVLLYLIPNKKFYKIENFSDVDKLVRIINNYEVNRFCLDVTRDVEQLKLEM